MKILSFHSGHNSTAAFFQKGEVEICVSEERFTKHKNQGGLPKSAIDYILNEKKLKPDDLDLLVVSGTHPNDQFFAPTSAPVGFTASLKKRLLQFGDQYVFLTKILSFLRKLYGFEAKAVKLAQKMDGEIAARYKLPLAKIKRYDHHLCHAAAVYYGLCDKNKEWLVITVDGGGDSYSSTVSVGRAGKLERIAATPVRYSLGCFYSTVTEHMGMKPLEHEYKVMGLSPYSDEKLVNKIYEKFKKFIWLDADRLEFKSAVSNPYYADFLDKALFRARFDAIAGATQKITEELLEQLVTSAVKKTGIKNIALAGGVFMNVKANLKLGQLAEVDRLKVFPSCGDESLPFGAAYLAALELGAAYDELRPVRAIYLGTAYGKEEVLKTLESAGAFEKYAVTEPENIDRKVGELLAENHIVARFSGRSEWGARALGNRSILANASEVDNIRIINEQIKNRDFWMPFAASILEERAIDYLVNPKKLTSEYMILAFNTSMLAHKHLKAGTHPYDFTCRPQLVGRDYNPGYYEVLKAYEQKTGMGGILNTSFNLHGEPLVESPEDALKTFENSGLQILALQNFLVIKK